jgi:hypothetical protein
MLLAGITALICAAPAMAKPKTHVYNAMPAKVFASAMRVISDHHVI